MGIDAITMGNHMWDKREITNIMEKFPNMVRPANYPDGVPGKRFVIIERDGVKLAIANLNGRTFMPPIDCPFQVIDKLLPTIQKETNIILIDIHAEATSEKNAMGWYLDGRVSVVLGTHTHVMTTDEQVLPKGTAYITDVGMVGGSNSIIGMNKEQILKRFLTSMSAKFEPTDTGPKLFNAVLIEVDEKSGKASKITKIIQ